MSPLHPASEGAGKGVHSRRNAGSGQSAQEVAQQQVDLHRVAGLRQMAAALDHDMLTTRQRGDDRAAVGVLAPVVRAGDDEHRAAHGAAGRRGRVRIAGDPARRGVLEQHGLGTHVHRPLDAVLALLGGVRLGEHLREEELREVAPVGQPVVAVLLLPAVVRSLVARRSRRRPGAAAASSAAVRG